jgi:hypothetical protein
LASAIDFVLSEPVRQRKERPLGAGNHQTDVPVFSLTLQQSAEFWPGQTIGRWAPTEELSPFCSFLAEQAIQFSR